MEPMALLLLLLMLGLIFLSVPAALRDRIFPRSSCCSTPSAKPRSFWSSGPFRLSGVTTLAIPLFILTAEIMNISGITDKLVQCCYAIVGRIRAASPT